MGQRLACRATFGGETSQGAASLETDHLLFRGTFRLRIEFREVTSVAARDGWLEVAFAGGGTAAFDLGDRAASWAEKIRSPKGLLDKLGVRSGHRVAVLGVKDLGFLAQLRRRVPDVSVGRRRKGRHLVFYQADDPEDLDRLSNLEPLIDRSGAIWVVSPKGRPEIRDVVVIEAAKRAGLVDTKVVRFSDTHTALKLVVPLARRAQPTGGSVGRSQPSSSG
jgi:hypothetical protein